MTAFSNAMAMFSLTLLYCFLFTAMATSQSLVEILESQSDLSTLLAAVKAVPQYDERLGTAQDITILAPTDSAFDNVPAENPLKRGIAELREATAEHPAPEGVIAGFNALLAYHTVKGYYPASSAETSPRFVHTWLDNTYVVRGEKVSNVTGGQNVGVVKTAENKVEIISGTLSKSTVVQADITAPNKVIIHKIDSVLKLPQNFTKSCRDTGNNVIVDDLTPTGLNEYLDTVTDLTIFIPSNEAIAPAAPLIESAGNDLKKKIMGYHTIVGEVIFSDEFCNGTKLKTQDPPNEITVTVEDGNVTVDQSHVVGPNIILSNGVGHVIDRIMKPADFLQQQQQQQHANSGS